MVSTYTRIKPSHIAAGVNVSYFGQNWHPKKAKTSAKSARDQLLIGMNTFSNECYCGSERSRQTGSSDFCPFSKDKNFGRFLRTPPEFFYPWKKDKNRAKVRGCQCFLRISADADAIMNFFAISRVEFLS